MASKVRGRHKRICFLIQIINQGDRGNIFLKNLAEHQDLSGSILDTQLYPKILDRSICNVFKYCIYCWGGGVHACVCVPEDGKGTCIEQQLMTFTVE